jgi:hypothetical protein
MGKSKIQTLDMQGEILISVVSQNNSGGNEGLLFTAKSGRRWLMSHEQDCCEYVTLEDQSGEWEDILNSPLLTAEVRSEDVPDPDDEYAVWTFYEFRTVKGSVTLRWYGTSNGYYSVEVDVEELR